MTTKLNERQIVDITNAYTINLESAQSIADRYSRTRQGIYKLLHAHGISPQDYGKLAVSCTACGTGLMRHRNRIRHRKHLFCDQECYMAYVEAMQEGSYNQNRQGQRVGRSVVSAYYDIQPGQIVHHEDRNTLNNHPKNLKVFANQGDHVRHHRWARDGVEVKPAWDGSIVI